MSTAMILIPIDELSAQATGSGRRRRKAGNESPLVVGALLIVAVAAATFGWCRRRGYAAGYVDGMARRPPESAWSRRPRFGR